MFSTLYYALFTLLLQHVLGACDLGFEFLHISTRTYNSPIPSIGYFAEIKFSNGVAGTESKGAYVVGKCFGGGCKWYHEGTADMGVSDGSTVTVDHTKVVFFPGIPNDDQTVQFHYGECVYSCQLTSDVGTIPPVDPGAPSPRIQTINRCSGGPKVSGMIDPREARREAEEHCDYCTVLKEKCGN